MTRRRTAEEKISEVAWEDPPPKRTSYDWPVIADTLRKNPMEWALIFRNDRTSVVNAMRQGAIAPLHRDLGFEYRTANNVRLPERRCDLYVRFNPDRVKPLREAIHKAKK
jgi:hypothetical protein